MKISMYSIVTSIIAASIFLSILCLWRQQSNFKKLSDVRFAGIAYLFCILRLLFPIDFSFTKGIRCEGIFSDIWIFLFTKKLLLFQTHHSIADIIAYVVVAVAIIKLFHFLLLYMLEVKKLKQLPVLTSAQKDRVLRQIAASHGKSYADCTVCCSGMVHMPFTAGILKSRIILPAVKFSDQELYFILLHEMTHIRKYDLVKKFLLQILFCVLWWVPSHSTAVRDLEQIIEIRCDKAVTKRMSARDTASYMSTILHCLGRISHDKEKHSALAFALTENQKAIKERFLLMASENSKKRIHPAILVVMLFIIGSYLFVPFPYYVHNIDESPVTSEAFLIQENGNYYIVNPVEDIKQQIPDRHAKKLMNAGIAVKGESK